MKPLSLIMAGIVGLVTAGVVRGATISNPSFEADGDFSGQGYTLGGTITGWTSGGDNFGPFNNAPLTAISNSGQAFAAGTSIPDGSHVAALQVYSNSVFTTTLSTTITGLTPGDQYYITYSENIRSGTDSVVDASVTVDAATIVAPHAVSFIAAPLPYSFVTSLDFTAGGSTATLTFINTKPTSDLRDASLLFDNVQVFGVPTPEPASLVLLGLGAVGLFAVARRRRSA